MKTKVWIGLIEVIPDEGNVILTDEKGAYVNVLALAKNADDYIFKVKEYLKKDKFNIGEISDVEPFSIRKKHHKTDDNIIKLSKEVEKEGQLKYGTFHTYNE